MSKIYVLSMANKSDVFIPFFFHSFDKAQEYMLEMFNIFIRKALEPYKHILDEDNDAEIEEIVTRIDHYTKYKDVWWILADNRFQIICERDPIDVYVGHIDDFDDDEFPIFVD